MKKELISTTAGATAVAGTYATVGALGTASTGTALSTLHGAVATKATMAAIGGGSLATGGLGIVGGACVLGAIFVGVFSLFRWLFD